MSCTEKNRFVAQPAAKASQQEQSLGDAVRAEQLLAFTLLISGESELTIQAAARLQRLSLAGLSPATKCLFHITSEAFALLREPTWKTFCECDHEQQHRQLHCAAELMKIQKQPEAGRLP